MGDTHRQRIVRGDGRTITIVQRRAHLSYCCTGCCCGRTERGYSAAPVETFKHEWINRKLRKAVHLTKAGCLGPCALANVASLVFDGRSIWFHSVNTPWHVRLIYDYIESMLEADRYMPPPSDLAEYVFNFYDWDVRPSTPGPRPRRDAGLQTLALLSHADTDLLTLRHARDALPPDLPVVGISLLNLHSDDQMQLMIDGDLADARIVVLRVHGDLTSVPGIDRLERHCRTSGAHLLVVSGTGEPRPELARVSTAPLDVLDAVTTYLLLGGERNLAECVKFLSDRLLLTGFGSEPPAAVAEHGIYLPDLDPATIEDWKQRADPSRPTAAILFYRAHLLSGNTAFIDGLMERLDARGLNALPVFTSSLRALDGDRPAAFRLLDGHADVMISTLSFALGEVNAGAITSPETHVPVLERLGLPVLQAIASSMAREAWEISRRGLTAMDTAINVAIPELDGRIITAPISFKRREDDGVTVYEPHGERLDRIAGLASRLAHLRSQPRAAMRVAFVLTNSSAKAAQVGNAVGLDAPASLLNLLRAMRARGYGVRDVPDTSDDLMTRLLAGGSYDVTHPLNPGAAYRFARSAYRAEFERLPEPARQRLIEWWGAPVERGFALRDPARRVDKKIAPTLAMTAVDEEPWSDPAAYLFAGMECGQALVALQPPRGYGVNPDAIYHTPDLPPTHHYTAFYRWLALPVEDGGWGADAMVHVGKHGTLEWLPGKGIGLSGDCYPDALLTDLPLVYPFILNDPGEGSQAKRRAHAVVVDHLMPAMTNADTYGPLAALNELVNEYYTLEKLDPTKLPLVQQQIWELIQQTHLQRDLDLRAILARDHGDHRHDWDDELTPEGVPMSLAEMSGNEVAHLIEDIDGYLCELGTAQIRDGLHTLGEMPALPETLRALTRLPNGSVPGLQAALANGVGFDLEGLLSTPGQRLDAPCTLDGVVCHSHADVLERLEGLARDLFVDLEQQGFHEASIPGAQTRVLGRVVADLTPAMGLACRTLVPALEQVSDEIDHVLDGLEGRYVPAGPAGAPTRGMAYVLPTGRNFYAVDPRAVPSQAAWRVGQQLAREVAERHRTETGRYPEMIGLGAWGTSQMRTQGDDIAEVLALLGVEPVWDSRSRRVHDLRLMSLERLGRPRIDVTLRISGFFRDAFPHLIALVDQAVELAVSQEEPADQNFPRKHYLAEVAGPAEDSPEQIEARARYRIFGARPGTYGAGIQQLLETRHWDTDHDFAKVFLEWGGYAYGREADGVDARDVFANRLRIVEVAVHNQDNREHDIFDSDDYYQFHGGMIATVRALTGQQPRMYFGDSSRPDAARVRDLREEALRVYRSRVVNPKWIESIKRHGYKGGLELTTTVDYIFGFDATAHVAPDFVYQGLAEHYLLAQHTHEFLAQSNPWALHAIAERLLEAADRGLWEAPAVSTLDALRAVLLEAETMVEARGETVRISR
jgi:cobaltochelatase CobN